ncbi:MAG: phage tail protein [Flavobacteriales bacterium]
MEAILGEIRTFAGNYIPDGWALCNGAMLSVNDNQQLFALIGTTYGGDGINNFALPNLCGRSAVNTGQGTGSNYNYALGQTAGSENVQLTASQLPLHNHSINASTSNANTNVPTNNYLAAPVDSSTAAAALLLYLTPNNPADFAKSAMDASALSSYGGNQPHQNLMPYTTVNFIIATSGIFPTFS